MIRFLIALSAWLAAGLLWLFTLRRWLFTLAALRPDRPRPVEPDAADLLPPVLLLVPVRNEAESLLDLFEALARLDYPPANLTVLFIDDGSTDASPTLVRAATANRPTWHLLRLPANRGKAEALNVALHAFPQGKVVAIYDADERPEPPALRYLVAACADPRVGAVSGRRAVSNGLATPAASYTTLEGLLHQQVTMRAKDRLALAPAILGANCLYRRQALAQVGNFQPGALLEDTDLTVRLARAGWQTRFEPRAVSYHQVPQTLAGYWRQHTRWARGFNDVAGAQAGALLTDRRLSLALRLELFLFSLGYLDRLALVAGALLALAGRRAVGRAVLVSLLTPLLQIGLALRLVRAPAAWWSRLGWLPFFFLVDIAMAATGLWGALRRAPRIWEERRSRR